MTHTKDDKNKAWKRTFIEWGVIGLVAVVLYSTGLHRDVISILQRNMLWTGLFDADTSQVATTKGLVLSGTDFGLSLESSKGTPVSLRDFKGKVIFINIWASWCPPCIAEMPTIETLYKKVGGHKNIQFVMLSMDQNQEKAISFMNDKGYAMPYFFPRSSLPVGLQHSYLPTTYVISKQGRVIYKKEGIADYSSSDFIYWLEKLAEK